MRTSIQTEKRYPVKLSETERHRLSEIAEKILENEPTLSSTDHFGARLNCGLHVKGPALIFADQSEIALYGAPESALLEYRMAVLAQAGDMLVISHGRSKSFETYLRDYLDIDHIDILTARDQSLGGFSPLPKRCMKQEKLFKHIAKKADQAGQLSIVPYMSTGHVWVLAGQIAKQVSADIVVAGPPPRLANRINDKLWFSYRVKEVLSQEALSPAFAVYGPAALASVIRRLADKTEKLVIKIPNSAGSTGNLSLEASMFRGKSLNWISARLSKMMTLLGWADSFPLKVEIWEKPILTSPSAQIWIPHKSESLPLIEGIFEQVIEGAEGKFIGAIKSRMPDCFQQKFAEQAMALAFLFQQLGYFGRCSLDALVIGSDYKNAKIHWVECNGRWGGVSVPMTLVNRLFPDPLTFEIVIIQQVNNKRPKKMFQDIVDDLEDLLYCHGKTSEGVVLLTPTVFESGSGVHYMTIAKTLERAQQLSHQAMDRLVSD